MRAHSSQGNNSISNYDGSGFNQNSLKDKDIELSNIEASKQESIDVTKINSRRDIFDMINQLDERNHTQKLHESGLKHSQTLDDESKSQYFKKQTGVSHDVSEMTD